VWIEGGAFSRWHLHSFEPSLSGSSYRPLKSSTASSEPSFWCLTSASSGPARSASAPALPSGRGAFCLSLNPGVTIASSSLPSATLFSRPAPHYSNGVHTWTWVWISHLLVQEDRRLRRRERAAGKQKVVSSVVPFFGGGESPVSNPVWGPGEAASSDFRAAVSPWP